MQNRRQTAPLRRVALSGFAILAGLMIGVGSAILAVYIHAQGQESHAGWNTWSGSANAPENPYAAAAIAFRGILSMSPAESRYYIRTEDEGGAPLRGTCTYQLGVPSQPARWWSLSLYSSKGGFVLNQDDAHSVSASSVAGDGTGPFPVLVSATRSDARHWLSNNGAEEFMLMLRLYQPDPDADMVPPSLQRISCEEEVSS